MTFTTRPELIGTFGMVASTHWLASASGMAVLEAGGNAYDAAVATGLTLHVVEPHLNGLAGEVPVIAHEAGTGRSFVVCGQGVAPAAATLQAFAGLGVTEIPGAGLLAATVPGSWGAWLHLLSRYGTLPLRDVARYAIGYAHDGYPLLPTAAATIGTLAETFREHWHGSAALYLPDGAVPAGGTRFRNPALAATLERLVAEGEAAGGSREQQIEASRRAFYSGFVAEAIETFVRMPAWDGGAEPHAGLLTAADLDAWSATEEEPAAAEVFGHRVLKTSTWGQGPVLLQQLQMLEARGAHQLEPGSADLVHTAVEVAKLALADREAWYGEQGESGLVRDLLDPSYAVERARLVGETADGTLRPGSPGGREPRLAQAVSRAMADGGAWADGLASPVQPGQGEPTVPRGDTCHLDVVDRWGNVVAATPSGAWLQSSPTIPELGFALGTRAQMFWLEEGLPASLVPGARPRTTLSPGMVLRDDGSPAFAFGTPGGDQQDQWTVPFLLRHLTGGEDLQAAIDAPSWHTTHVPSSFAPRVAEPRGIRVEERLGEGVIAELRRRGHEVTVAGPWSLGRISAAGIRGDGMLRAAANARGMQGYAVGR